MSQIVAARERAAKIGASSASFGDFHTLFAHHQYDVRDLRRAEIGGVAALIISGISILSSAALAVVAGVSLAALVFWTFAACRYLPGLSRSSHDSLITIQLGWNLPFFYYAIALGIPTAIFAGIATELTSKGFVSLDKMQVTAIAFCGASLGCSAFFRYASSRAKYVWGQLS